MSGIVPYTDAEKVDLVTFPVLFGSQIASLSFVCWYSHLSIRYWDGIYVTTTLRELASKKNKEALRITVPPGVGEGSSFLVSLALARRFFPLFLFRVCVPKGFTVPGVFSEDRGN